VRSLGNKSAAVLDTVVHNSLDLFAVVESWHDSAESPSIIASTPPGYCVFERARLRTKATSLATNHGGICIFIRQGIQASLADLPLYKSFEHLSLKIRCGELSFIFVVIYRPDPASSLAVNDIFFDDLADLLERTSTFAKCTFVGDVNIHLDDTTSTHATRFTALLDDFGLHDIVGQPTHRHGHQLDVFVTRRDQSVKSVTVDPPLLSAIIH